MLCTRSGVFDGFLCQPIKYLQYYLHFQKNLHNMFQI